MSGLRNVSGALPRGGTGNLDWSYQIQFMNWELFILFRPLSLFDRVRISRLTLFTCCKVMTLFVSARALFGTCMRYNNTLGECVRYNNTLGRVIILRGAQRGEVFVVCIVTWRGVGLDLCSCS